jgi:hypothetical protein
MDELCTCDQMDYGDEHTCPFSVEIYDDIEFTCTCCPECEYQCAMDI